MCWLSHTRICRFVTIILTVMAITVCHWFLYTLGNHLLDSDSYTIFHMKHLIQLQRFCDFRVNGNLCHTPQLLNAVWSWALHFSYWIIEVLLQIILVLSHAIGKMSIYKWGMCALWVIDHTLAALSTHHFFLIHINTTMLTKTCCVNVRDFSRSSSRIFWFPC
jgi:hypothetical protein